MISERHVKKFCCEDISLIENYNLAIADTTQTWQCHHRGEVLPCGRFSRDDLKKFGLYYKRPAAELIFLTPTEHHRLHKKGVPKSEDHKKAISDAKKGVPKPYLKGVPRSEATKKAISDSLKGIHLSEDHKKAISDAKKGVPNVKLSKKVLQFTKSGEFVREWQSTCEASRQLVISQGNICSCCNGKRKSVCGYVWRYA